MSVVTESCSEILPYADISYVESRRIYLPIIVIDIPSHTINMVLISCRSAESGPRKLTLTFNHFSFFLS
jgi:hypothetical protein